MPQLTQINGPRYVISDIIVLMFNSTMRKSLLNCCHLVSISKNVVFYASLVVRIY